MNQTTEKIWGTADDYGRSPTTANNVPMPIGGFVVHQLFVLSIYIRAVGQDAGG
jgi:hypothetical protein